MGWDMVTGPTTLQRKTEKEGTGAGALRRRLAQRYRAARSTPSGMAARPAPCGAWSASTRNWLVVTLKKLDSQIRKRINACFPWAETKKAPQRFIRKSCLQENGCASGGGSGD
uniref:Uncharacterized protein n=1 Tax=Eutreptiella gymnastica TaxID=73025 RepID=A0A7S4FST1_9EUGL